MQYVIGMMNGRIESPRTTYDDHQIRLRIRFIAFLSDHNIPRYRISIQ